MIEKISTKSHTAEIQKDFANWWETVGSAIIRLPEHDHAEHAKRVALMAWEDSRLTTFFNIARKISQ